MTTNVTSIEPATGEFLWMGETGDVDAEVATARAAWSAWAVKSQTYRMEALRRFARSEAARLGVDGDAEAFRGSPFARRRQTAGMDGVR